MKADILRNCLIVIQNCFYKNALKSRHFSPYSFAFKSSLLYNIKNLCIWNLKQKLTCRPIS